MKSQISNTNVSFSFLRNSSPFLNMVLNNINGCVLLLDSEMNLRAFNEPMKTIFSNKEKEDLLYMKCGEAIGCAHQVEEMKECGQTSQCNDCELRLAAMDSYLNNVVVYKEHMSKKFMDNKNNKVDKHLQFSTRLFIHDREKYIMMLIEDITELVELKENGRAYTKFGH
jgi:nitrogen fixation/metabolism regulation signal transduction histidine kinase